MDVPISELRANLKACVERVKAGEDVVVTDRGIPVARLTPVDSSSLVERLEREGVISPPPSSKRIRSHQVRPVEAKGSVSAFVTSDRDKKR